MKQIRFFLIILGTIFMVVALFSCNTTNKSSENNNNVIVGEGCGNNENKAPSSGNDTNPPINNQEKDKPNIGGNTEDKDNKNEPSFKPEEDKKNILVVYFSCTNTTKGRAETLQARLNADIYQIIPEIPYTTADLNYNNNSCRANQEQRDENCRPAIRGTVENLSQYAVIYIGYPIWWGQAPKIIYTFLESYNFEGITLIPFCTSGGSGMGTSGTNLHSLAPNAIWKTGCLVRSENDINSLINMK